MRILLTFFLLTLSTSLLAIDNPISRINKINAVKKEAAQAFAEKDYTKAIERYRFLVDSMEVSEEPVMLNLGNAYLLAGKQDEAQAIYQGLAAYSGDAQTRSTAYQQLAVIAHKKDKNIDQALEYLKMALRNNPRNEDARYNYELLKKLKEQEKNDPEKQKQDEEQKKEEQKKQEQEQKDKQEQQGEDQKDEKQEGQEQEGQDQKGEEQKGQDQKGQEQEGQDKKGDKKGDKKEGDKGKKDQGGKEEEGKDGQDGEDQKTDLGKEGEEKQEGKPGEKEGQEQEGEGEKKPGQQEGEGGDTEGEKGAPTAEQLMESMNISPEKAKMILEAMRDSEVQYLQQMRRAPSKKTDRSKPDW